MSSVTVYKFLDKDFEGKKSEFYTFVTKYDYETLLAERDALKEELSDAREVINKCSDYLVGAMCALENKTLCDEIRNFLVGTVKEFKKKWEK